ncbi:MAG: glycosyltransferase family 9 protein [Chromatiales bacterium]|jgi:ADP-heptose:LPS heptosyltransferase
MKAVKSILVVTLSNIGDAVMTTPVFERLHELYPDALIDIVCDPRSQELFRHCPYRGEMFLKIKQQGKAGLLQLIKRLRKKRYDLIVDLRTDGLAWLLRARRRLTKWGHQAYGPHAVEDLISIIDRINPERRIPPARIWLSDSETQAVGQLTRDLPGQRWLAIGPGANWPPKIWDADNFAAVANQLAGQIDAVIVIGSQQDESCIKQTLRQLQLPALDLAGKTSLLCAAAVLQQCTLFIGNDSGLGHLASTVGTSTITVFGPGKPERYHPWGENCAWFQGEQQSFSGIMIEAVVAKARELLAAD